MEALLNSIFLNPRSGAAFSSLDVLFKKAKLYDPSIKKSDVDLYLRNKLSHVLYRKKQKTFPKRKIIAFSPGQQICVDLMQLSEREKQKNYPYTFIYVQADLFAKLLKLFPLKSKSAKHIKEALQKSFSFYKPKSILIDRESAFYGSEIGEYLKKENVKLFSQSSSPWKNGQIEVNIRFIRRLFYRIMTQLSTERFIDKLEVVEQIFNRHKVRSTNYTPLELHFSRDNIATVQEKLIKTLESQKQRQSKESPSKKLMLGDVVRHVVWTRNFAKEVEKRYSTSLHKIIFCKKSYPETYKLFPPPAAYHNKTFFYKEELFKVDPKKLGEHYLPLEKVLKEKRLPSGEILYKCALLGSDKFEWLTNSSLANRYMLFPHSSMETTRKKSIPLPLPSQNLAPLTRKQKKDLKRSQEGIHTRLRGKIKD